MGIRHQATEGFSSASAFSKYKNLAHIKSGQANYLQRIPLYKEVQGI
jgi:hypothetical protein